MPGAGAQIRIRGGASLSASNDPLYVIDGLVIDNNTATGMSNILANINPNDIENFTVLKSASATAIYGSRASNGVVIITTKKGRSGQKPTFTYNGDFTISTALKKYDVLSGDEYRNLIESLGMSRDLLGTANTDWQDEILRTTLSTNHSISMQGGLKNMPYRVSAGRSFLKLYVNTLFHSTYVEEPFDILDWLLVLPLSISVEWFSAMKSPEEELVMWVLSVERNESPSIG